ncbi:MAG TPA: BlaI/MecI/CopY family transcriptional regulator [Terriglobales bacterium]|nr:BlaI/MecI/CopY family transcriptional regulator [Terriglobales bacterium]
MRSRSGAELPQLELECLAALWALEQARVRQVHARLAERGRPLAYTTVLTVLERLLRKQVVERRREGRGYVYAALVTRQQMRERALERLVGNYFDSRQELEGYLRQGGAEPAPAAGAAEEPALLD